MALLHSTSAGLFLIWLEAEQGMLTPWLGVAPSLTVFMNLGRAAAATQAWFLLAQSKAAFEVYLEEQNVILDALNDADSDEVYSLGFSIDSDGHWHEHRGDIE
jgi:hypothetical protein